MADLRRYYLDSNVLIAIVERRKNATTRQIGLMDAITAGEVDAVTSEFSLSECLVKPISDGDEALVEFYQRVLSSEGEIQVTPVARDVLIEAAKVRSIQKIKLPDAIHFATAWLSGCTTFITNDRRLANAWPKDVVLWDEMN